MGHSDLQKLFDEKNRVARLSQIREIVFGAEDGLLVPLGVVSGVAGATTNNFYVLIAGLAEAFCRVHINGRRRIPVIESGT